MYWNQVIIATTISNPSQKPGIARNSTVKKLVHISHSEFGRTALMMPTGKPISQDMATEINPIWALIGPRCAKISIIGSPRKNDSPSLPDAMSRIHTAYCTASGLSKPKSRSISALCSGVQTMIVSMP